MKTKHIFHSSLEARSLKLKASSGFTIIETLVAISILLLSIIGPLTIANRGLAASEVARHEITAFYLAQEAIEYVRNVRDMNAIAGLGGGASWLQGLDACRNSDGCGIDPTAPSGSQAVRCNSLGGCVLYTYTGSVQEKLGLFGHQSSPDEWTKTDFTRKVSLTIVRNNEATVNVNMAWKAGSLGTRTLDLSENILNWYVPE